MIPEKANTEDFPDKKLLCSLEGGSVSLAEKDNQFLVITEEYAVWDMLDGEDQAGLSPCYVRRFETEADRKSYLIKRGWIQ